METATCSDGRPASELARRPGEANGRNPKRRRAAALATLGLSLLIAFVLAEALSRLLLPAWQPPAPGGVAFFRWDPLLGWSMRPSWSGELELPSGVTRVTTNTRGLRDREYSPDRSESVRRVLVLGDSYAFGFGVEDDKVFDRLIESRWPQLEIINAAVPGYGTDQEYLYLVERGLRLDPDLVLLLIHPNDVLNNTYRRQYGYDKPRFVLADDGALDLEGSPVPAPGLRDRLDRHVWRRSFVLHRLYRLTAERIEPTQNLHAAPELAFDVTEALLANLHELLRAHGVGLLVAGIPKADELTSAVVRKLEDGCRRRRVPYFSLEQFFAGTWEETLDPATDHWTAEGHRVAAAALERPLLELLADSPIGDAAAPPVLASRE